MKKDLNKMEIEKMNKEINLKLDRNFLMMIFLLGISLNITVYLANGKMPIKVNYDYEDANHFSYQNNNEIKLYYLSDIIRIPLVKNQIFFSFGDLIILFTTIGLIINIIELCRLNYFTKYLNSSKSF